MEYKPAITVIAKVPEMVVSYWERRAPAVAPFFCVLLAACGSPGEFKGTVGGLKLDVSSAMFTELRDSSGAAVNTILVLSSRPDVCADTKANRALPGTTEVVFNLSHHDTDNSPLPPDVGAYDSGTSSARRFTVEFEHLDSSCNNTLSGDAARGTGTVNVHTIVPHAGGSFSGSFTLTFGPNNDAATGNFDTSYCDTTFSINPACG